MVLMHINRLGLVTHLYGSLFNCITIFQGSWAGAIALCVEIGWCCTVAVSACSVHQIPGCECTGKRSCIPFPCLIAAYMSEYDHMQPYVYEFKSI